MQIDSRRHRVLPDNCGISLVEVLLGAVIMSLLIGLFFTLFRYASQNLMRQTEEISTQHSFIVACDAIDKALSQVATFQIEALNQSGSSLHLSCLRDDQTLTSHFRAQKGQLNIQIQGDPERVLSFYEKRPEEVRKLAFSHSFIGETPLIRFSATIEHASQPISLYRTFRVRLQQASGTLRFPKVRVDQ